MICTPIGMPPVPVGHIGAATTGQPANEIGWVSLISQPQSRWLQLDKLLWV